MGKFKDLDIERMNDLEEAAQKKFQQLQDVTILVCDAGEMVCTAEDKLMSAFTMLLDIFGLSKEDIIQKAKEAQEKEAKDSPLH